jgi:AcrR family transcriptional regulator
MEIPMPRIYSDEKRDELKKCLLAAALELIKRQGLRKMAISELTERVGIAQGTFYNFFPSKEMIVYELARSYQLGLDRRMDSLLARKGYLDRQDLGELYRDIMLRDEDNVLRYLSPADLQTLMIRLPGDYAQKLADSRARLELNIARLKGRREAVDTAACLDWIQLMSLAVSNRGLFLQDGFEKMIDGLIDNLQSELFEEVQ